MNLRGNVNMEGVGEERGWTGKDTNKIFVYEIIKIKLFKYKSQDNQCC